MQCKDNSKYHNEFQYSPKEMSGEAFLFVGLLWGQNYHIIHLRICNFIPKSNSHFKRFVFEIKILWDMFREW